MKTLSRSFFLPSGVRFVIGIEPTFWKPEGKSPVSSLASLVRNQSNAPSISLARSRGVCFFLLGSIWSILAKSPVGSSSGFLPFLIQFITPLRSFSRSSGVRRVTGIDPSFVMAGTEPSTFALAGDRIQSNALSISRARSLGLCLFVFGKSWSSFLKSPVGSFSGFFPPRIQVMTFSRSFFLSSGDRRVIGIDPNFWKPLGRSSSLTDVPLLLIQSKAPSISLARSRGVCFFFLGSIWSILAKFPEGSSLGFRPFLIQFITSFRSFIRSSGVRRVTGIEPRVLMGSALSSGSSILSDGERTQSKALSISRALSSGLCFFVFGSI